MNKDQIKAGLTKVLSTATTAGSPTPEDVEFLTELAAQVLDDVHRIADASKEMVRPRTSGVASGGGAG